MSQSPRAAKLRFPASTRQRPRRIRHTASRDSRVAEPHDHLVRCCFARENSVGADQAVRPFETDDATTRCGQPAGPNRVGVDGGIAHAARNSGGRSARRSAGDVIGSPRILDWTMETHESGGRHTKRVHVRLANHNRTGVLQPADDGCVMTGNAIREALECRGGLEACSVVEILHGHGNTVQWPAPAACLDFGFGNGSGSPSRLGIDRDEGIETRVERFNSCKTRIGQTAGDTSCSRIRVLTSSIVEYRSIIASPFAGRAHAQTHEEE